MCSYITVIAGSKYKNSSSMSQIMERDMETALSLNSGELCEGVILA